VGDAGHARGAFQIDDRYHGPWLAAHAAAAAGRVPPLDAAADFAAALLAPELLAGRAQGLRDEALLRFAAAAYNAGRSRALRGLAQGDPDLETTGRDYGRDVVARLRLFRLLLAGPPAAERMTLEPGALGAAVAELKRLLHRFDDLELFASLLQGWMVYPRAGHLIPDRVLRAFAGRWGWFLYAKGIKPLAQ